MKNSINKFFWGDIIRMAEAKSKFNLTSKGVEGVKRWIKKGIVNGQITSINGIPQITVEENDLKRELGRLQSPLKPKRTLVRK